MAHPVHSHAGGIRSLVVELRKHGEAIEFDLISRGWTRRDIGVRLTWMELRSFLRWMPPTAESAYYRARKPNSWWVTPDLQLLSGILYALEGANWQRGGGQGKQPKPVKFPEDRELSLSVDDMEARRDEIRRRFKKGDA